MKALRVTLLIVGIFCAVGFITGVQSVSWSSGEETVVVHYHGWQRLCPLFCALFCFVWAFGLTKRHVWAWYMGCTVFILMIVQVGIFQALLPFFFAPTKFERWWYLSSQSAFAFIIFLLLKKWWLPKRPEFRPTDINGRSA
jgi:hypothetical protein